MIRTIAIEAANNQCLFPCQQLPIARRIFSIRRRYMLPWCQSSRITHKWATVLRLWTKRMHRMNILLSRELWHTTTDCSRYCFWSNFCGVLRWWCFGRPCFEVDLCWNSFQFWDCFVAKGRRAIHTLRSLHDKVMNFLHGSGRFWWRLEQDYSFLWCHLFRRRLLLLDVLWLYFGQERCQLAFWAFLSHRGKPWSHRLSKTWLVLVQFPIHRRRSFILRHGYDYPAVQHSLHLPRRPPGISLLCLLINVLLDCLRHFLEVLLLQRCQK